jgi:hypothetical protein
LDNLEKTMETSRGSEHLQKNCNVKTEEEKWRQQCNPIDKQESSAENRLF